jgi:secreted Zn-dependent insulinase-like peptidase
MGALREALINFHTTYYSADIMKLAVVGRESLDQLQVGREGGKEGGRAG